MNWPQEIQTKQKITPNNPWRVHVQATQSCTWNHWKHIFVSLGEILIQLYIPDMYWVILSVHTYKGNFKIFVEKCTVSFTLSFPGVFKAPHIHILEFILMQGNSFLLYSKGYTRQRKNKKITSNLRLRCNKVFSAPNSPPNYCLLKMVKFRKTVDSG